MHRTVALRKESVDRNIVEDMDYKALQVALRKESVDRNVGRIVILSLLLCRSPQGERG